METLTDFTALLDKFKAVPEKKRVVVVCPDDEPTYKVVEQCIRENLCNIEITAVSDKKESSEKLKALAPEKVEVHYAETPLDAAKAGVRLVHEGKGDVLMKGLINTDVLLKAVLDKEIGLLPKGNVMSHIALVNVPTYHKLFMFSDAAVIPEPTLEQFVSIIKADTTLMRKLGVKKPKVALIHFTEKVNEKFPHTLDYVKLKEMAEEGVFGDIAIGGPMDAKTACDLHASQLKGISNPVAGDSDILILPNLEAGNVFYKALTFFAKAEVAGMLSGTKAPVVIPSRADSHESKLAGLAMACLAVD